MEAAGAESGLVLDDAFHYDIIRLHPSERDNGKRRDWWWSVSTRPFMFPFGS